MEPGESMKKVMESPELARSLEEALRRNAGAEELVGILIGAGLDAEAAEEVLAEYQRKLGFVIGTEKLDRETLRMIAGGDSTRQGGCTQSYYERQCSATVEDGSWCGSNDWCVEYSERYKVVLDSKPLINIS